MEKDVFRFEDFLNEGTDLESMKLKLIKEGIFTEEEIKEIEQEKETDEVNQDYNPYKEVVEESASEENSMLRKSESDHLYKLYKDKSEDFICDIAVEGVDSSDTEVRLIIESEDWNLMFTGKIINGKCIIPIKKLNILSEGQKGKIKLEVNADGNLFIPWEDDFIVKVSKKVTVKVNEGKYSKPAISSKRGSGIKVNVKK